MNQLDLPPDTIARRTHIRQMVFGATLVAAGVILVLDHRTIFHAVNLWPLFLVGWGASRLVGACCAHERRSGVWVATIGLWFALNQLTPLGYGDTWPLLLVAVGALVVWDAVSPVDRCPACAEGHHDR